MGRARPAVLGGRPAFPEELPLARPRQSQIPRTLERIRGALESGMLTNGPMVRELEERVADRLGVAEVVAVASCTTGLMLVFQALGLEGPVVMPSFTFAATGHAARWVGATPRFVDVLPGPLTLDPAAAEAALEGAGAVVAVHLYGTPAEVEPLERVAAGAGVPLVFDAAHALGSRRGGIPIGGFGTAEVFSLSPTKITVAGEGGLITTDDRDLADACRLGRDYGNPGDYDCRIAGLNGRMSELHAAVALASLDGLDDRVAARTASAASFRRMLGDVPGVGFPTLADGDTSTVKDLTLRVRAEAFGTDAVTLAVALDAEGVDTRRYYSPPLHRQQAYADLPEVSLPVTEHAATEVLTVPLHSDMEASALERVAGAITAIQEHADDVAAVLADRVA